MIMKTMQSLLKVPHNEPASGKRVFFGQVLVETTHTKDGFAKDVASSIEEQSELVRTPVLYQPGEATFVSRMDGNEHVMVFEGDLSGYFKIPQDVISSLNISFCEVTEDDKNPEVKELSKLSQTYVLTISMVAFQPGELGEEGFWYQVGTALWNVITVDGADGRKADENVKLAIVYV